MSQYTAAEFYSTFFPAEGREVANSRIEKEVVRFSDTEILRIDPNTHAEYLQSVHSLEVPILCEESLELTDYLEDIHRSKFPPGISIAPGIATVRKQVIVFHLPFIAHGNQHEVIFSYVNIYDDEKKIQAQFDQDIRGFKSNFNLLKSPYLRFNQEIRDYALKLINERKQKLQLRSNFLSKLNVPVKKNDASPKTFTIPAPALREKIIVTTPDASRFSHTPEPTLEYGIYQQILKCIDDLGRNMERMPSIYEGKGEEDLRDLILSVIDPNFVMGSATGETFNRKGKTDISLHYDSKVVFIAECKFWTGKKGFYDTIDQLLRYLTWRDSKTAIVLFVENKEITRVINTIKSDINGHTNFLRISQVKAENRVEYIFYLPGDMERELTLTVLIFHLPPVIVQRD